MLSLMFLLLVGAQGAEVAQVPITNYRDQVYLIPVTVGKQELQAVLDTGSSDTWFASSTFKCSGSQDCKFGRGYAKTASFSAIGGQRFSTVYASEHVDGTLGTETLSLGNVTVERQAIGVVDQGTWKGDGISSGLVGMGFPSGSAIWNTYKGPGKYSPLFSTIQSKGLANPLFSITLNRVNEGPGALTLGGLPTGSIKYDDNFTSTKMQYLTFGNGDPNKPGFGDVDPRQYRITIDGFVLAGQTTSKAQLSVDTGTAFTTVPKDVARTFNNGFTPKATFDRAQGYVVDCNAKAPTLSVKINGAVFELDGKDLILPPEEAGPGGKCTSAVQEGSFPGSYLLGAHFLKNVVAVFDVGKMEMRFAKRLR